MPVTNINTTARVTKPNILFIQPPCAQSWWRINTNPVRLPAQLRSRKGHGNRPGHNTTFRIHLGPVGGGLARLGGVRTARQFPSSPLPRSAALKHGNTWAVPSVRRPRDTG